MANRNDVIFKVITGVRDPIDKEISHFFEGLHRLVYGVVDDGKIQEQKVIEHFRNKFAAVDVVGEEWWTSRWVDEELNSLFDIDVYDYSIA